MTAEKTLSMLYKADKTLKLPRVLRYIKLFLHKVHVFQKGSNYLLILNTATSVLRSYLDF